MESTLPFSKLIGNLLQIPSHQPPPKERFKDIICNLLNRSIPGFDHIFNTTLKHCNKLIILHICRILSGSARLEFFLNSWKNAAIIMILKPQIKETKNPKSPSNYWPIDNEISSSKKIKTGVSRDLCLFPQLFAIFIKDLPSHSKAKVALFSDDTLLYATENSNPSVVNNFQKQTNKI